MGEEFVLFVGIKVGEDSAKLSDFVWLLEISLGGSYVPSFKASRLRISWFLSGTIACEVSFSSTFKTASFPTIAVALSDGKAVDIHGIRVSGIVGASGWALVVKARLSCQECSESTLLVV